MVTQKVRRVGNSFTVTIPREEMELQHIKEGDTVSVEVRRVTVETRIKPTLSPVFEEAFAAGLSELDADMRFLSDR